MKPSQRAALFGFAGATIITGGVWYMVPGLEWWWYAGLWVAGFLFLQGSALKNAARETLADLNHRE